MCLLYKSAFAIYSETFANDHLQYCPYLSVLSFSTITLTPLFVLGTGTK